jgi:enolase
MKIKEVRARRIFNSNGDSSIEVEVKSDIKEARSSIGAGTSVGKYEVVAYPKDINKVVNLVNKTFNKDLKGVQIDKFNDLEKIERYVKSHDFSENMKKLGGNVLVALELAIMKASSEKPLYDVLKSRKLKKMPMPLGNCIEGGKHAGGKGPDFQEFLVLPRVKKFEEAYEINTEIHKEAKLALKKYDKDFIGGRTMEGGWNSRLSNLEVIHILKKIVDNVSKEKKIEVRLGLDIAADSLWNGRRYEYKKFSRVQQKRNLSVDEQIESVRKIIRNNNLVYVEDPFHDSDFSSFEELNKETCLICGDDLISTNPDRLETAKKAISAVIVKPNQIGSLLKTKEVIDIAKKNKIMPVMSHRSGETEDNVLAHLAVGWECPIIKTGIVGGERISKLNELLRISEDI